MTQRSLRVVRRFSPRDEQYHLGTIVQGIHDFDEAQQAESETWANLRIMQSGAVALSANDRTLNREAL
jgi:hypothetical protein